MSDYTAEEAYGSGKKWIEVRHREQQALTTGGVVKANPEVESGHGWAFVPWAADGGRVICKLDDEVHVVYRGKPQVCEQVAGAHNRWLAGDLPKECGPMGLKPNYGGGGR